MNVSSLKYFKYDIPFVEPLRTASGSIDNRKGAIVRIEDDTANTAYGEIAPLEILDMTPLSECFDQIRYIKKKLVDNEDLERLLQTEDFAAEVRFGFEQAIESLKILEKGKVTSADFNQSLSVNAMLGLEREEGLLAKTDKLIKDGYSTIKIKIDNLKLDEQIITLNRLWGKFGNKLKIRLDANRSLKYDEAVRVISMLNPSFVEYFEDPVMDIEELVKLSEEVEVQIAPDEFITLQNVKTLLDIHSINYFVIKPMKFGFYNTLEIIKAAESKGKSIVISSVFESAVGRSGLVYLASLIKGEQAHGLGTKMYLSKDLDDNIYPCDKPMIEFESNSYPPGFNFEGMLE